MYITCNRVGVEYDIHSLIKAFYPSEEIKVVSPATGILPEGVTADMEIITEEPFDKNAFKADLYKKLCMQTGKTLPWGNLIGIRPTKIPMFMLEEGKSETEIADFMKKTHFVSDEKIALSIDIAKREKELLDTLHYEDGYSLYIGIPFCPTTCLYCSFTSYPICSWKKRMSEYLDALEKEIDFTAEIYHDKKLDTIYIGGGTPTTLEAAELDRLLTKVKNKFQNYSYSRINSRNLASAFFSILDTCT